MKLGIGIDTGGTYTDAVVYSFEEKKILSRAKALTTKNDLSLGILDALGALDPSLARRAEVISLSTTLATNACVEDKAGRARLIFFGGNKKVIDEMGGKYGLPSSDDILIPKYTGGQPDWELFERQLETGFDDCDGVGIIEMNAMHNGAAEEKKAREIFLKGHSAPVVCGHELFSGLNCLQRGSSTLLNAALFPVISSFLDAVKKALAIRGMNNCALVIVRSDGSLMSEEFASLRPVETLLCGPAASAIGCTRLADSKNSVVVDMGGTTTDIAIVKDGVPVTVKNGVSIGKWKTFVNGLYVKTFGLGGDTAVRYNGKGLYLEDYRVIPLCVAASEHPCMLARLKELKPQKHTHFLYEHYVLIRDESENPRYTEEEKALLRALRKGPLTVSEAARAAGRDIYSLNAERLMREGVIQLCGFTPTDAMHIKGDFCKYSAEAAIAGARFAAYNLDISVSEVCERVYDEVKRRLYINIVKALLENERVDYMKNGISQDAERFISESYEAARAGGGGMLSCAFKTPYALVGVGAPIGIFLDDVAKMLGTRAEIPEGHEVANALGAVVGSVSASCSVRIKPESTSAGIKGYIVYAHSGIRSFESLEEASAFAAEEAGKAARAEAERRGARGNITVTTDMHTSEADARECRVYLGTTVTARAAGSIGF